jgi:uncharacterized OsmC-like protein
VWRENQEFAHHGRKDLRRASRREVMLAQAPGTIHLGKFRVVYEEEREPAADGEAGYLLQQRAVVRLNDELVKLESCEDYTVLCDEANFRKGFGKSPSPLQYFIASIGFCMFSQLARFAAKLSVLIDDAELDLRMTYDLQAKTRLADFATAAQSLNYVLAITSSASPEQVLRLAQLTDKGCHTVNSMRNRVPVVGKLLLNDREFSIVD